MVGVSEMYFTKKKVVDVDKWSGRTKQSTTASRFCIEQPAWHSTRHCWIKEEDRDMFWRSNQMCRISVFIFPSILSENEYIENQSTPKEIKRKHILINSNIIIKRENIWNFLSDKFHRAVTTNSVIEKSYEL